MANKATVSVILCTFNRKDLVVRAIESVVKQLYEDWELIIVDDGSTDGSEKLLLPLSKKDGRIVYVRHKNKGVPYSRNAGIRNTSGAYIAFIDSDDEYRNDHLKRRVSYLESHRNVKAVFGGVKIVGPRAKHFVPDINRPGKKIHISKCHPAGTLVVRKESIMAMKGFRILPFGDDYDLIKRLQTKYKVVRMNVPTYIYHVDGKNRVCDLFEAGGGKRILEFQRNV